MKCRVCLNVPIIGLFDLEANTLKEAKYKARLEFKRYLDNIKYNMSNMDTDQDDIYISNNLIRVSFAEEIKNEEDFIEPNESISDNTIST